MATATKSGTRRRKTIEAVVTVAKFTERAKPFTVVRPETSFAEFIPVHGGDYLARGSNTPLRDATARFITHLESLQRPNRVVVGLLADESGSMSGNEAAVLQGINDFVKGMAEVKAIDPEAAGTVLAVIATDGRENASGEVSQEALHAIVEAKEEDGWTFFFLGAQIDAWDVGRGTVGLSGGVRGQTISYENTPKGTYAAMQNVTTDSMGYLGDTSGYVKHRASSGTMRSVTADGKETTANINAPQGGGGVALPTSVPFTTPSPYSNVEEALKTARGATAFANLAEVLADQGAATVDPDGAEKLRGKEKTS